jgi:hypothetical protein
VKAPVVGAFLAAALVVIGVFLAGGLFAAFIVGTNLAFAATAGYLVGWHHRGQRVALPDLFREQMRVTPRQVPLEQRHIHALLAFGENCFGPMELDDDHDEAMSILRENVAVGRKA